MIKRYVGDGPGWFRYLLFTCAVEAQPYEVFGSNNFRERVAKAKGINLSNVRGLSSLWIKLRGWLADQQSRGLPYRTLILPDPGSMSQIGYSVNGTFPTWRDAERMERLWGNSHFLPQSAPLAIARAVRASIHHHSWSDGFRAAFADFEDRTIRGFRLIRNHPFLIQFGKLARKQEPTQARRTVIDLYTDIDGQTSISISSELCEPLGSAVGGENWVASSKTVSISEFTRLDTSASDLQIPRSVTERMAQGLLVFNEGMVGWRYSDVPDGAYSRLLIKKNVAERHKVDGENVGSWVVTGPMPFARVNTVVEAIRGRQTQVCFRSAKLIEGIRVAGGFLGLPQVLPKVEACEDCEIELQASSKSVGQLEIDVRSGAIFQFTARGPLRGRWSIRVNELNEQVDSLTLDLCDIADEYELHDFRLRGTAQSFHREVSEAGAQTEFETRAQPTTLVRCDETIWQLAEAVYAGGRSGWPEVELVGLIARFYQSYHTNSWDILRLLGDSGWLACYSSIGWQARHWYLRAPRLLNDLSNGVVILDGATPWRTRERFQHVVAQRSGTLIQQGVAGGISLPMIGAKVSEADAIAEEMSLELVPLATSLPLDGKPLAFEKSRYGDEQMTVVSHYSWDRGRFELGPAPLFESLRLERLVHVRRTVPECYRIASTGQDPLFLSTRVAGLMAGHMRANRPLFDYDCEAKVLARNGGAGFLPTEVSRYLALRNGCNPTIRYEGGCRSYQYPCSSDDLRSLSGWFSPCLFKGDVTNRESEPETLMLSTSRQALARRVGLARATLLVD